MKSDSTQVPLVRFEKKKKSWYACWDSFETHYKAQYKIRFQLKPAHIDSEMWFGGQKYGDASFEVMWEDVLRATREARKPYHENNSESRVKPGALCPSCGEIQTSQANSGGLFSHRLLMVM